ncbi:Carboxyl-terminal-processing peptidase 3, chloroplastic [Zea mays]|uniref:C-terminal processing peptidase n=1 Tax=Zea mays TaxID=4577 RepID=A0A3L6DEU5_MAIZE|nr:Carboxyl-terminal-processing peptidase 3, chloroplastic [Zea mays]
MEMVECSLVATLAPRPLPGQVRKALPRPAAFGARARLRVRSVGREEPLHPQQTAVRASGSDHGSRALGQAAVGFAAAAVVSLTGFSGDVSPLPTPPARAESLTVAFPVSKAREVNRVQRTLVETWGLIRETFVDPTFNHQDWDQKLQQTMVEIFPLKSADAAYSKISGMLSTLGDPFTRIISPKEYQSFRIGSDGNVQGVGVFINKEPSSGRLLVMDCIQGGPADRAGIHEGDELVEIDGKSVSGLDGEAAAQRLRGRVGTTVKVKFLDGTDDERCGGLRQKEVQLSREIINLSPLSTAIISHRTDDGHECKTGYVRLASFSQGGLVKAGLDVAQIWLDGDETLVNTIDREGNVLPINMIQGHSLTHDPLVVLVNEGSASASEILAGALHDNGRAILSVTELDDGSALFITVAKYLSPALHEIDQVGIQPDIQCSPDILSLPRAPSLRENSNATNLEMDSCIMVAEQALEIQQSKGSAS